MKGWLFLAGFALLTLGVVACSEGWPIGILAIAGGAIAIREGVPRS